jgi:hypothetical protein
MLRSSLIGGSPDLVSVAAGQRRIQAPEASDSVARIQQALICLGFELPEAGPDGVFGGETGNVVSAFKADRQLFPTDPVVGPGTTARLDLELAYLEGVLVDEALAEPRILASEPFFGGTIDAIRPDLQIPDKILRFFELSNEFCFPLSPLFGTQVASNFGRIVEPKFKKDYQSLQGISGDDDFFDLRNDARPYTNFLRSHNPLVPEPTIAQIGGSVRPDILRHRNDQPEWYEIKPLTPSGVAEFLVKGKVLRENYQQGFPYAPGRIYTPSREISFGSFFTGSGTRVEVFIEARRPAPAMILYRICIRGDYVRYFNEMRLIAGMLAILAVLASELVAAGAAVEEVEAMLGMLRALAASFGVTIPTLGQSP